LYRAFTLYNTLDTTVSLLHITSKKISLKQSTTNSLLGEIAPPCFVGTWQKYSFNYGSYSTT